MLILPPATLLETGLETLARLEREPARWVCHHEDRAGVTFDVEMSRAPGISRAVVHVDFGSRREHLATIVDDGTFEYVLQDDAWSRWRSREAPLEYPQVRVYIEASTPSTIVDLPEDVRVRAERGGVTTLALPLPREARDWVESEIAMLRS
ncbi:MAG: hypothetical protein KDA28_00580, partial [Phycisphaerales bacterium]|nr:hypothetical protein [Phycisphaerales bacterium]